eukprot:scaffold30349_cov40-Phaeocystis_antarctica.AAC.2
MGRLLGETIEVRGEGEGAHLSDLRLGLIDRLLRPRGPLRARLDRRQCHVAEERKPCGARLRSRGGRRVKPRGTQAGGRSGWLRVRRGAPAPSAPAPPVARCCAAVPCSLPDQHDEGTQV